MAIKQEIKRRAKQPTTSLGALALMLLPTFMPDVEWDKVIDAVNVIYEQIPMIQAGFVALFTAVAGWNICRDEEKDA